MALNDEQRHSMIREAVLRQPDRVADTSVALWRKLAEPLCTVIGPHGFACLYGCSVHQLAGASPWLADQPAPLAAPAFAALYQRLQQQDLAAAGPASIALLSTCIDTLSLLIGEAVTSSFVHAAWGHGTLNHTVTELKESNESRGTIEQQPLNPGRSIPRHCGPQK